MQTVSRGEETQCSWASEVSVFKTVERGPWNHIAGLTRQDGHFPAVWLLGLECP